MSRCAVRRPQPFVGVVPKPGAPAFESTVTEPEMNSLRAHLADHCCCARLRAFRPAACAVFAVALATNLSVHPAPALAQAGFDYDFDHLAPGPLVGQDAWSVNGGVRVGAPGGLNSTQVVHGVVDDAVAEAGRYMPAPFYYTVADTAIEWRCQAVMFGAGVGNALAGPSGFGVTNGEVFGIAGAGAGLMTTYLSGRNAQLGDRLSSGHWYEFRVIVNFAIPGGRATLSYRDLTLGETAFATDFFLHDVALGDVTDAQGRYPFESIYVRVDDFSPGQGCFVDNIHIGAPGSSPTGVGPPGSSPTEWSLAAAPNPASRAAQPTIRFGLPAASHVRLAAYDVGGRLVRLLADGRMEGGPHVEGWDLKNSEGRQVAPGVYFLRLEAGGHARSARLVCLAQE
jgi:hypothetical protein